MGKIVIMRVPERTCWDSEEHLDKMMTQAPGWNARRCIVAALVLTLGIVGVVGAAVEVGTFFAGVPL